MSIALDLHTAQGVGTAEEESCQPPALRVLIVDDDETNCLVLSAMLAKEGYTVLTAADGQEALVVFDREQPDMVLMDVMMPVMDGYEATRRMKACTGERFVPVIFLTALQDQAALVDCIACGGDDFLTKPYKRPILRAKLKALERVRALYATLKAHKDELAYHHTRVREEQRRDSGGACAQPSDGRAPRL